MSPKYMGIVLMSLQHIVNPSSVYMTKIRNDLSPHNLKKGFIRCFNNVKRVYYTLQIYEAKRDFSRSKVSCLLTAFTFSLDR